MKEYKFKINGKDFHVAVNGISGTKADVTVNGVNYDVELENAVAPVQQAAPAQSAPVLAVHRILQLHLAAPRDDMHRIDIRHAWYCQEMGAPAFGSNRIRYDHRQHSSPDGNECEHL